MDNHPCGLASLPRLDAMLTICRRTCKVYFAWASDCRLFFSLILKVPWSRWKLRCRLVVVGIELGGRWSEEAAQFIRLLARSRSRATPPLLRSSARAAYVARWSALLSFAAARALAASLLSLPLANAANVDG